MYMYVHVYIYMYLYIAFLLYKKNYFDVRHAHHQAISGNVPWAHVGPIGLWHDSQLCGSVKITGCALIALRNDKDEWEPYDVSESARKVFPFETGNLLKHQVPQEILQILAKSWNRMYAWFLEDPCKYETTIPVQIRRGAQRIQSMDEAAWILTWTRFVEKDSHVKLPTTTLKEQVVDIKPDDGKLTILGMSLKDAFQLLEGDATMIIKSYKPDIDFDNGSSLIHVAACQPGHSVILGTFVLKEVCELKSAAAIRKLESEGNTYHKTSTISKHFTALEKSKPMWAWMIENQQSLQPPLTWITDPRTTSIHFVRTLYRKNLREKTHSKIIKHGRYCWQCFEFAPQKV